MQPLRWDRRPDGLRAPALVCAFKGWNDAGESASSALSFLGAGLGAERFAVIDPEEFVDFQSTRPTVRLVRRAPARDRVARHRGLRGARPARAARPRDPRRARARLPLAHVLRDGASSWPRRWACSSSSRSARCSPTSRTRAPSASPRSPSDDALVDRLALDPPTYEGPTGIVGVLHDACENAGMPSASLWAAVPHYVAVVPNPKGSLALVRRLESLIGITVDAAELEDAAGEYERQVSRAVEMDPDVQAFVEKLERTADEEEERPDPSQLPVRRRARARVPALPAPARQPAGLGPARARAGCCRRRRRARAR